MIEKDPQVFSNTSDDKEEYWITGEIPGLHAAETIIPTGQKLPRTWQEFRAQLKPFRAWWKTIAEHGKEIAITPTPQGIKMIIGTAAALGAIGGIGYMVYRYRKGRLHRVIKSKK